MAENTSIKRNVPANYIGQIYFVLLSFIIAPVYLSYMGTEVYVLIGFFTMLSAWLDFLDVRAALTISRQEASYFYVTPMIALNAT